jgi:kynurenine 3-monooxygenase
MNKDHVAIVGAGLVGSLEALFLAKRGYRVSVFERRPDIRKTEIVAGRSINLALSDRGWKALEHVGIAQTIKEMSIPMYGRMIHDVDGNLNFQPYSKDGKAIYSVSRGGLNQKLLEWADENDHVSLHFDEKCSGLDLKTNTLSFKHTVTNEESKHSFDRIIGTDGAFSAVRGRLRKTDRFNYSQEYLTHGYKELIIPPNPDGTHRMELNALHIWPRGEFMLIALPNLDGSYTVTLFFPFEGPRSFASIKNGEDVKAFFNETFPDAVALMPTLVEDYYDNPTSSLVMIKCSPWHYEDKVCLMGDASHAIVPFYGQGMNAGFEDCTVFEKIFAANDANWGATFKEFSKKRKPDADAICELALRNYIEMRDLTADPQFVLQKKIEKHFSKRHPELWTPLYEQVTFSHVPYSEALKAGEAQDAIMKRVMDRPHIAEIWDGDEVEQAIIEELKRKA